MTSRKQASNKANNKQEKVDNRDKALGQKGLPGVLPSKKDEFEKRRQELLDETQRYMYQQSSKFSSVSRSLVLGIIGTIWVLTYVDGNLCIPNRWLLSSLITGLVFLLTDVIHYFWDSMSYHIESYKLDSYQTLLDIDRKHEPKMDEINKRSHWFIVAKFCILIIAAILFGIGLSLKIALV